MRCKICGKRSDEALCLRCEKIRDDVIMDLAREFGRQEDVLCAIGVEGAGK